MEAYTPFVLPLVFLFWLVAGLIGLIRAPRTLQKKLEKAKKPLGDPARLLLRTRLAAMFWLALGLAGLLFSGFSAGIASDKALVAGKSPPGRLATLVAESASSARQESGAIGMVVAVVSGDEEVVVGVGQTSTHDREPPDVDTLFEIGSISKVFTSILLAEAIEQGELTLETRAQDLLPEGVDLPAGLREQITLRHLTTHSSGFPRLPANFLNLSSAVQIILGYDPHRDYDLAQFEDAISSVALEFQPGEKSVYSNFGVSLLGHLLATEAGQSYEQLMQSRIAEPLGMASTVVELDDEHRARMAPGYRETLRLTGAQLALKSSTWDMPDHYAGAGGIRSSADDMLLFLKANMGKLESPLSAAIESSHQSLFDTSPTRSTAMNWVRSSRGDGQAVVLWHNGGTGGYGTFLGFTEDGEHGVVVMANTSVSIDDFAWDLLGLLERQHQ